ncbi:transcriptional regulator%2C y4mF family [Fusobacterium polymorphum]|uniref:HTH cro/C1-type domain-containing protein n=1 Tax=Fusobacterium polymorphum ATCC 10953 TaxID=393480 RepID=A5TX12_FUSNP|nr:helix-turn-helix transcriptional regulator [Fusobacterium polymorphum]EDK89437.1 hypothetical protein FNP_1663 [Fusobacterium polymorphum ATCC 10953]UTI52632.1 helix-turn-helix domain-containing protein [Fusobacterium polymorphum]WRL69372.1 helix-turn-helix transcriptional regulator [Fusobacterium polymorphum]CKH09271.1 transcriptional regulator%2C y4mF family [Fusobacterium polymorphum]
MYDYFLGLLIKKFRISKGLTQKELANELDKSEISIKKYETGVLKTPFSVLFMTVHMLGIDVFTFYNYLRDLVEEIKRENRITQDELDKCVEKLEEDALKIYKGWVQTDDLEPIDDDKQSNFRFLYRQIFGYVDRFIKNKNEENKTAIWLSDEETEVVVNDIIDYLNYKIEKYYNGELNEKEI